MSEPIKKSTYPTITVRTRNPELPPTGANTIVLLDGEPLKTAHFVKVEVHARRMTKVTIEMFAYVECDDLGALTTKIVKLKSE